MKSPTRAYILCAGSGPILILSTYSELTDERLVSKLRYKGIDKIRIDRFLGQCSRS